MSYLRQDEMPSIIDSSLEAGICAIEFGVNSFRGKATRATASHSTHAVGRRRLVIEIPAKYWNKGLTGSIQGVLTVA